MIRKKELKKTKNGMGTLKKAIFTLSAPEAHNVSLAGDFNSWNVCSHSLKRDSRGIWKISLNLKPGSYEYRFIVDGTWQNDPKCSTFTPNPFGSKNCVLTLK